MVKIMGSFHLLIVLCITMAQTAKQKRYANKVGLVKDWPSDQVTNEKYFINRCYL